MDLNEMLVFARVVQAGSFTTAAAALGMPKSTVSRKVSELEERLKARLLQRTTRKLSLTDVGRTYYDYCARIVGEIEDAERAVSRLSEAPRGILRVTAPINVSFLGPIVADYVKRYPEVRLELFCTARTVDLVEERFDLGIRAGILADSTLIAKSLGQVTWFLAATPAYLKKRGRPRSPDDLKRHDAAAVGAGTDAVIGAGSRTLESEDLAACAGDQDGVLELGGQRAVGGDDRPPVFELPYLGTAEVDHRLNGDGHALVQARAQPAGPDVRDCRWGVHEAAASVPPQLPQHAATPPRGPPL